MENFADFIKKSIEEYSNHEAIVAENQQMILKKLNNIEDLLQLPKNPELLNGTFLEKEERFFYEIHHNKIGSLKTLLDNFPSVNSASRLYNLTPKEIEDNFDGCGVGARKLFVDFKKKFDNDWIPKNVTQSKISFNP
jgi:hypothetical protein